ncbi:MAG: DUF1489 family protein [Acetobacteraceae bacterium]
MLHLMKLCVGVRDPQHLRRLQQARLRTDPPLRHRTRHVPRRRQELLAGGSLYWVISGALRVRQRLVDIVEIPPASGGPACALILAPRLTVVEARLVRPFQGWRYLEPAAAPADLRESRAATGAGRLPEPLREALAALCLL